MPPLEQASPPGLRALGMRDRAPCRCPTPQLCLGRGGWVQACAVRAGAPTSKRETRKGALGGHLLNLLSSPLSSLLILIHSHPPLSPQHSLAILNSAATDAEAEAQLGLQLEQVSRQVRGREGERERECGVSRPVVHAPLTPARTSLTHTHTHTHTVRGRAGAGGEDGGVEAVGGAGGDQSGAAGGEAGRGGMRWRGRDGWREG